MKAPSHAHRLVSVVALLTVVAYFFLLLLLPPRQAGAPEPTIDPAGGARLLDLANAERSARGLPLLSPRSDLADAAERWALALARSGELRHDGAWGPQVVGVDTDGVDALHARWMASAEHRAIVLDPASGAAGAGVAVDAEGQWWGVTNFARPPALPPTTAATAPEQPVTVPPAASPTTERRPTCTCP